MTIWSLLPKVSQEVMLVIISGFSVFDEGRTKDLNMAEGYKWRLETLSHEMLALQASGELNNYE